MKVVSYTPAVNGEHRVRPLLFCCGVIELGYFMIEDTINRVTNHPTLEQLPLQGTGVFIVNYIQSSWNKAAKEYLDKHHTLLYQADNWRNTSPSAGEGGLTGITTCLYLHKDANPANKLADIYKRKEMV